MQTLPIYELRPEGLVLSVSAKTNKYKKVVSKEDFDRMYFDQQLSRAEMSSLGIGSKVFQNSYHHYYPDRAERVKIFGKRISKSQKSINSNHKNAGKPRILLDRVELTSKLETGMLLFDLAKYFGVSEPTVSSNLDYYQILPFKTRLIQGGTIARLKLLERLTGRDIVVLFKDGPQEVDMSALSAIIEQAESDLRNCKQAIQKLKHNYKLGGSLNSRYEWMVKDVLDDLGLRYTPQYRLGKYSYDFRILESNFLLEVDGEGHNYSTDSEKENLAKERGFNLVRVDCAHLKNKRQCLNYLESLLSKSLEKPLSMT